jgi:hypothetical protein
VARVKGCVFCGRSDRKITREHVFAGWVDAVFPSAAREPARTVIKRSSEASLEFESLPFEQKVAIVCAECNNNWMSALETSAGPILGPMVGSAIPTELTPAAQRSIATWATKTALVLQYLHPANRIIPDGEYHRFYSMREPLPEHVVLLARRESFTDQATGVSNLVTSREQLVNSIPYSSANRDEINMAMARGAVVYRVTFALGFVIFVVLGHTFPMPMDVQLSPSGEEFIRGIWPIQSRSVWPAPRPVEQMGGLEALHDLFEQSA